MDDVRTILFLLGIESLRCVYEHSKINIFQLIEIL